MSYGVSQEVSLPLFYGDSFPGVTQSGHLAQLARSAARACGRDRARGAEPVQLAIGQETSRCNRIGTAGSLCSAHMLAPQAELSHAVEQLFTGGADDGLRTVGRAQFAHDLTDVDLHRAFGQPQLASDDLIGLAPAQKLEDLVLAVRKAFA